MEVIAPVLENDCAGKYGWDTAHTSLRWEDAVNKLVDDVWEALVSRKDIGYLAKYDALRKTDDCGLRTPAPPVYTNPPPSYEDAIRDLPPDYTALPPLAERKNAVITAAPQTPVTKSNKRSSSLLKDRSLDVYIDFESPAGVREHKKKKAAAKRTVPLSPPANSGGGGSDNAGDDQANGDGGGGDAGGGEGGGDGDGDGGGGDDDWNAWTVSGSKKKSKKKEEEEEEEKKKAAEASAGNTLSWADEVEDGADDSWAGFATVGKKKKGKVRIHNLAIPWALLTCVVVRSSAWRVSRCKLERWSAAVGLEFRYRPQDRRDRFQLRWMGQRLEYRQQMGPRGCGRVSSKGRAERHESLDNNCEEENNQDDHRI